MNKSQQESWRDRFEKGFADPLKYDDQLSIIKNSLLDFISTERQRVIEEVKEMIENMNSTTHTPVGGYSNIEWLEKSTLLTALTKLGKKNNNVN